MKKNIDWSILNKYVKTIQLSKATCNITPSSEETAYRIQDGEKTKCMNLPQTYLFFAKTNPKFVFKNFIDIIT